MLYGASGFVGLQTVAYFQRHAPKGLRWAVAGRSEAKLRAALQRHGAKAGLIVADAEDQAALDALASQARVVLSTAGPFALFGSKLVDACVRHGTHYVDITGETPWVRGLIDRHHATAQKQGTRIVPCCGFDSVPADLGVWFARREFEKKFGVPPTSVKAAYSLRGGFNGGTLASVFNLFASKEADLVADPLLLNPSKEAAPAALADPVAPRFDADLGSWLAPFLMGPVNTRVVRRTAALLDYAPGFAYQEYLRLGRGAGAAVAAGLVSTTAVVSQTTLAWSPVRALAQKLAPKPGEGPSEESMDKGGYRYEWFASDDQGRALRGRVKDQGDPGNRATTRMLCESALALALQFDQLPGSQGGVLTPASGLGEVLFARLQAADMRFEADV